MSKKTVNKLLSSLIILMTMLSLTVILPSPVMAHPNQNLQYFGYYWIKETFNVNPGDYSRVGIYSNVAFIQNAGVSTNIQQIAYADNADLNAMHAYNMLGIIDLSGILFTVDTSGHHDMLDKQPYPFCTATQTYIALWQCNFYNYYNSYLISANKNYILGLALN